MNTFLSGETGREKGNILRNILIGNVLKVANFVQTAFAEIISRITDVFGHTSDHTVTDNDTPLVLLTLCSKDNQV